MDRLITNTYFLLFQTIIHVLSIVISIGAFYIYSFLYNSLCVTCFGLPSSYGVIQKAVSRATYTLATMLACVVALLPRLVHTNAFISRSHSHNCIFCFQICFASGADLVLSRWCDTSDSFSSESYQKRWGVSCILVKVYFCIFHIQVGSSSWTC